MKTYDPVQLAVEDTYNAILDLLVTQDISKAVAVTALLNIIGEQFEPGMADDDARLFVEKAFEWIEKYFKTQYKVILDESGYGSGI